MNDKQSHIQLLDLSCNKIDENGLNTLIKILGKGIMKEIESISFNSILLYFR